MDRVLILYSNPSDTERLRLDKEHRAIDQIIAASKLPDDTVTRCHATTFEDFVKALTEQEYAIVQFSGHGSGKGIYLESVSGASGEWITADRVASLLAEVQPGLKAAIFMSCFSAGALPELIRAGSYVLTVFGPADDAAVIRFISTFYKFYFSQQSIERSYLFAQQITGGALQTVIARRAMKQDGGKVLFQVFPSGDHLGDSFLVDLHDAERDIDSLGVSRETFLSVLSRKIRLHRRIFDSPRERAILPIGQFFGVFSWQNAADVIKCHRILRIKPDADDKACDVWASIAVQYNDNAMQRYRLLPPLTASFNARMLDLALKNYRADCKLIYEEDKFREVLDKYVSQQYKLTKSVMAANLDMAERKLDVEDFPLAVVYLESALSAMHDLLDALTDELTVNV